MNNVKNCDCGEFIKDCFKKFTTIFILGTAQIIVFKRKF